MLRLCNLGPKKYAPSWSLVRKENDDLAVQYKDVHVLAYSYVMVHSLPSWSVIEIKCTFHVTLPKCPINKSELDQQSRQQPLRAYCPNVYTVPKRLQSLHILVTTIAKILPAWLLRRFSD